MSELTMLVSAREALLPLRIKACQMFVLAAVCQTHAVFDAVLWRIALNDQVPLSMSV